VIQVAIEQLREKIDGVDARILALIEERVELAKKIGTVKKKKGLEITDPKREDEIVRNLMGKTRLNKKFVKKIFQDIISYCRENEA